MGLSLRVSLSAEGLFAISEVQLYSDLGLPLASSLLSMVTRPHERETYTKMKMEQEMRFLSPCVRRKLRFFFKARNNKSHGMNAIGQISIGGHSFFSFVLTASMGHSGWRVASLCTRRH